MPAEAGHAGFVTAVKWRDVGSDHRVRLNWSGQPRLAFPQMQNGRPLLQRTHHELAFVATVCVRSVSVTRIENGWNEANLLEKCPEAFPGVPQRSRVFPL